MPPPVYGLPTFPSLADIWYQYETGPVNLWTLAPPVGPPSVTLNCQLYSHKNAPLGPSPAFDSQSRATFYGGGPELWIAVADWDARGCAPNNFNFATQKYSVVKLTASGSDWYYVIGGEQRRHLDQVNEYHCYFLFFYLRNP